MQDNQEYKTALPGFFTLKEIADILGYYSTSNLVKYCKEGRFTTYKVEKIWLVPYNQGLDFINKIKEK